MQIFIVFLLLLVLLAFIIYKVNNKFEQKESLIFLALVIVVIGGYLLYDKQQEEFFPNAFKENYLNIKKTPIKNLSYELLNNKNITSKDFFVYKFTYVIEKEGQSMICTMPKVEIEKIGGEFVFKNFSKLQEHCQAQ